MNGIGFRSLTEALDTKTARGLLVFHMFSALAEIDRSLIRERTRAGLSAARRIGRMGGRPPKLTDDDIEPLRRCSPIQILACRRLRTALTFHPRRFIVTSPQREVRIRQTFELNIDGPRLFKKLS